VPKSTLRFRAVLFDLFDTLVDLDPDRFPEVEINGRPERTTSRAAYDALCAAGYSLSSYPAFHALWMENTRQVWGERDRDPALREVSSRERFRRLAARLVPIPPGEREAAAGVAREAHMKALIASTDFNEANLGLLGQIRRAGLRAGLLSNFDDGATVRALLARTGLLPLLDPVLISEEAGYRKPSPRLFGLAAAGIGSAPAEILFVGDNFAADVLGARGAGMSCAWLNPKGASVPERSAPPDFDFRRLEECLTALGLAR
jgi:FMN phosphatase YigB (HAD superfamily)